MNKPNIIFLDIDGVLNTTVNADWDDVHFDPTSVSFIHKLVKEHNCQIVISSTWRLHHTNLSANDLLHVAGLGHCSLYFKDWSTDHSGPFRGQEIQRWLERNEGEYRNYVIFDDDRDMLPSQFDNFILTDHFTGVGYREYAKACQILGADSGSTGFRLGVKDAWTIKEMIEMKRLALKALENEDYETAAEILNGDFDMETMIEEN